MSNLSPAEEERRNRRAVRGLGWFGLCFAALFLTMAAHQLYLDWTMPRWETVTGTLTSRQPAMGPASELREEFKFTYAVAGVSYKGDRYSWDRQETSPSIAPEKLGLTLARGKPCTVHYDPAHPSSAVLVPRVLDEPSGLVLAGLLLAGLSLLLFHPGAPRLVDLVLRHGTDVHEAVTSPGKFLLGAAAGKAVDKVASRGKKKE